jgi:hypothetical protein
MHIHDLHPWDVSLEEALRLQGQWRDPVTVENRQGEVKRVTGAEVVVRGDAAGAPGITLGFPDLERLEDEP